MDLQLASGVNWPMLAIVVCWSLLLFCGYGLVSPFNATVVVSMALGAIAVASAIFLIIELTDPFVGAAQAVSPGRSSKPSRRLGDVNVGGRMRGPFRIEGHAIVSEDGMIADSTGLMPDSLKFESDQKLYEAALDEAAAIVNGRMSYEWQANSPRRKRLVVTRQRRRARAGPKQSERAALEPGGRLARRPPARRSASSRA